MNLVLIEVDQVSFMLIFTILWANSADKFKAPDKMWYPRNIFPIDLFEHYVTR